MDTDDPYSEDEIIAKSAVLVVFVGARLLSSLKKRKGRKR